jgi:hypothetical protein
MRAEVEEEMNGRSNQWLLPLAGVGFVVLGIVSFIVQGEPKDADHPVNEIVDFYLDNKDAIIVGQLIGIIAGLLLIVFGAYLAKVLRAADERIWVLPLLPLIGFVVMDIGFAIDGTILIALAEAADDIEPTSVQTLQALWDNDFLPIALGILIFLFSFGISVVRSGVLPKWLGWVAIVLGIVGLIPPIGFAAFIGTALIILIVSILLSVRARREGAAPATT